jgi:hypothetical protein
LPTDPWEEEVQKLFLDEYKKEFQWKLLGYEVKDRDEEEFGLENYQLSLLPKMIQTALNGIVYELTVEELPVTTKTL